jgi:hypothetical protein
VLSVLFCLSSVSCVGGSCLICVVYFIACNGILHDLSICVYHGGYLIRGKNCLPFASTWVHTLFFGRVCVSHLFSFLCCVVLFAMFVFVLCLVCQMLPVSLDCPFGFLLRL